MRFCLLTSDAEFFLFYRMFKSRGFQKEMNIFLYCFARGINMHFAPLKVVFLISQSEKRFAICNMQWAGVMSVAIARMNLSLKIYFHGTHIHTCLFVFYKIKNTIPLNFCTTSLYSHYHLPLAIRTLLANRNKSFNVLKK